MPSPLLGELLTASGAVSDVTLARALRAQENSGRLLGEILAEQGSCTPEQVTVALGEQLALPVLKRIPESVVQNEAVRALPAQVALKHQALPLAVGDGCLTLAVADPFNFAALEDARFATGLRVEPVLAPPGEVQRLTERFYMQQVLREEAGPEELEVVSEDETEIGDLQRLAKDAVVIQWVNMVLRQAVQDRASDVHIEPFEAGLRVRYRVDGVLHEVEPPPRRLQSAIISRVKIMASLDIAERRLPQDGRIKLRISGKEIDLRVSTVPTVFGESVVLRILERTSILLGLEQLGMLPDDRERFERVLKLPHGIVLVTGPTGSGKTTTLYAALRRTYSVEKKILTVEDPVEYQLEGINQIHVRPKIGLTFAGGLRHILRQDPDIIMVGEIRDGETAEVAFHAALTGHLVFSTLHTNDSGGAVVRLLEMGVEPFLVASAVEAVLAQRLVRRLCEHCAEPDPGSNPGSRAGGSGSSGPRRAVGCEECRYTGYRGRLGIFELLLVDDAVREMVANRATAGEITEAARRHGTRLLVEDGLRKVAAGLTTLEEVTRVTRQEEP